MIGVLAGFPFQKASDLVLSALRRSVSHSLAISLSPASLAQVNFVVAISPDESAGQALLAWLSAQPRKLILFGSLPPCLQVRFGLHGKSWPPDVSSWSRSLPAPSHQSAESLASVRYTPQAASFGASSWTRALERFDFTDEWNNLAFGAIRADGSIWSVSEPLQAPPDTELASIEVAGEVLTTYVAHFKVGTSSALWVNRPVGLIDSFEWRLVEYFIAHWQNERLPCLPVISELPWDCDAAVTMRLDCDEDITSARPLWNAYREMGVPLSLAIHTTNLHHDGHHAFLKEYCDAGGVLMSHTATHAPNWGGSYESALVEARESHQRILTATGVAVDYAVSPFHQSPHYALQGLCDAGYKGCIGGIIRNDPEFLLARGGELTGLSQGFVGHSQQTMLHGDCMLADGDPLAIFKAAFDRALETRTLFGYLDHPFSERYAYGWANEASRIQVHRDLISYIRSKTLNPRFMDEGEAMDFLRARADIRLLPTKAGFKTKLPAVGAAGFGVEYRGELLPLTQGSLLA